MQRSAPLLVTLLLVTLTAALLPTIIGLFLFAVGLVLAITLPSRHGETRTRRSGRPSVVTFVPDSLLVDRVVHRGDLPRREGELSSTCGAMADPRPREFTRQLSTDASRDLAYALSCRNRAPDWRSYYSRTMPTVTAAMRDELDAASRKDKGWRMPRCSDVR